MKRVTLTYVYEFDTGDFGHEDEDEYVQMAIDCVDESVPDVKVESV